MTTRIHLASLTLLACLAAAWLAAPVLAQETEYLFGLSEKEILEVMDRYAGAGQYDEKQALEEMRSPFDCRRAGDLCTDLGTEGAYSFIASAWSMALEGYDLERIGAVGERLLSSLSDRYLDVTYPDGIDPLDPFLGLPADEKECSERVVFVDHPAGFRLRQRSGKLFLLFAIGGYNDVTFFRKNARGKFEKTRTETLTEDARGFVLGPLGPEVLPTFKVKQNDRNVTTTFFASVGAFTNPHAEGCGSSTGLAFLSACSCTGPRPAIYGGL